MDIALRGIVLYAFIVFILRVIGRRELSSLSAIDLVLLIVLGDAVQQGLTQDDYSVTGALIAVSTIAILQVGLAFLSWRFNTVRRLTKGEPIVLVQNGEPIERNLHRERIRLEELAEKMRVQQIDSIDSVAWALLEPGGDISFIEKK